MADLEPIATKEVAQFGQEARGRSTADLTSNYQAPLQSARGLLQDSGSFNQGLGYSNPTLSAIKSKYAQDYGMKEKAIKYHLADQASEDNIRKIQIANQLADQEIAMNKQREQLRHQIKNAKRAARAAAIGNILGIAGGAGGAAYGGPAGGMAGAGAGQGIGNAIGGGI